MRITGFIDCEDVVAVVLGDIMKQQLILLAILCILIIAILIAPVNALAVVEGEKIIVADGATSPMVIVDNGLAKDGTISIDVTKLNDFVANGDFTTENVVIDNNAIVDGWSIAIENNILNLTLTGRSAEIGETVFISLPEQQIPGNLIQPRYTLFP